MGSTKAATARIEPPSNAIDLVHLRRATFGDEVLAREVLALFDRQAEQLIERIAGASSTSTRREVAHLLKGAALGVGAHAVAEAAEEVEAVAHDPERFGGALASLSTLVAVARLAIAGLTARG